MCFDSIRARLHRKRTNDACSIICRDLNPDASSNDGSSVENDLRYPIRTSFSRCLLPLKLHAPVSAAISLHQIIKATGNFSPSHQIGEGGFGKVYRATLENGEVVAVKRARKEHFEHLQAEFRNEVELLTRIAHRNLVKLLGYIDAGSERLIITEYITNGTLREHLEGRYRKLLDFDERLQISIDISHALSYLHQFAEQQIIHRDVKSSNILLTDGNHAKVTDFGFARVGQMDSDKSHVLTRIRGTLGYLDPEYVKTNKLTPRSDVYSFGILLIEILTGRRPVEVKRPEEEKVTLKWVFNNYRNNSMFELVDPTIRGAVRLEVVRKMFSLAIWCAAPSRSDRPDMNIVVDKLCKIKQECQQKHPHSLAQ